MWLNREYKQTPCSLNWWGTDSDFQCNVWYRCASVQWCVRLNGSEPESENRGSVCQWVSQPTSEQPVCLHVDSISNTHRHPLYRLLPQQGFCRSSFKNSWHPELMSSESTFQCYENMFSLKWQLEFRLSVFLFFFMQCEKNLTWSHH